MSNIYELTQDYLIISEMMENPELDPEFLADTMEAVEGAFEVKAEAYAKVMKNLEGDIEALKAEADRLTKKRQAIENNIKNMKKVLQGAMEVTGKIKFKTDLFSFRIQKNAPSVIIDEQYIENIPEEYLIPQDPKIDKAKLKEDLKAGVNLEGIAHLEQSESIRIG